MSEERLLKLVATDWRRRDSYFLFVQEDEKVRAWCQSFPTSDGTSIVKFSVGKAHDHADWCVVKHIDPEFQAIPLNWIML